MAICLSVEKKRGKKMVEGEGRVSTSFYIVFISTVTRGFCGLKLVTLFY